MCSQQMEHLRHAQTVRTKGNSGRAGVGTPGSGFSPLVDTVRQHLCVATGTGRLRRSIVPEPVIISTIAAPGAGTGLKLAMNVPFGAPSLKSIEMYNRTRPHAALADSSPEVFEAGRFTRESVNGEWVSSP